MVRYVAYNEMVPNLQHVGKRNRSLHRCEVDGNDLGVTIPINAKQHVHGHAECSQLVRCVALQQFWKPVRHTWEGSSYTHKLHKNKRYLTSQSGIEIRKNFYLSAGQID